MKHYIYCFIIAGLLATSGCAWYNITPIQKADAAKWGDKDSQDGYVIYQPELYFAATVSSTTATNADKLTTNQAVTVSPIYLPNPSKAYRVTTHNFLAKADFEFTFQNGWQMTQVADKSDNSTVATALAGQMQTILAAAGAAAKGFTPSTRVILFKPKYGDDGTITSFSSAGEMKIDSGGN
jgi:hypothetical protein